MIVVDTSVWIDFFRGREPAAGGLRSLLDDDEVALAAPIRVEILSGASRSDLARLRVLLSALPSYEPGAATWTRIDAWIEKAVAAGQRFGVGDLLIAAIAADRDLPLWSLDADFDRMAALGFVRLHRP